MDKESNKKSTASKKTSTAKRNTNAAKKTTSTAKKTSTTTKKTNAKKGTTTTKKTTTPKVVEEKTKPIEEKVITKEEVKQQPTNDNKMILIIVLALLIAVIAIAKIAGVFDIKDYSKSYLLKHKVVTNEIVDNNLSILPDKDAFILVTSLNNEEEYNLEKDLKKVIKDNKIKDNFYVYIYNENNKVNLNNIFQVTGDIKLPTILYYKNGKFVDMVKREDQNMIEAADFVKLLDIYELSK